MPKCKMVEIDKNKLIKALKKRGSNRQKASLEMGRCAEYLSQMSNQGSMSYASALMLENVLNIKPEEYCITNEEEREVKTQTSFNMDEFFERLDKTIYSAVYNATKAAWKES